MSSTYRYQIPVEQTQWKFEGKAETSFTWEYEDGREKLLNLYDKGKKQQWDAATRIDWTQDLDPENPMMLDDRAVPIWGSPVWDRLTDKERTRVRHHLQAQTLSQFMHGEQGALDRRRQDRPDRARRRRQVLRGDPGHGRGAPRRGLRAAAPREVRARLSRSRPASRPCSSRRSATAAGT